MALDPIKIEQIRKKMLAQGFKEDAITAAVEEAKTQYEGSTATAPVPPGSPPSVQPVSSAPASSSSQPSGGFSSASSPSAPVGQTVTSSASPTPEQQPQDRGFVGNFFKSVFDLGANYAKFVGEAGAQGVRAVIDPNIDAFGGGQSDEMNAQISELSAKSRALTQQAKAIADPNDPEKARLLQEARDLDAQVGQLGDKAGAIGDTKKSYLVDENKIATRGDIAETGARATAGAMSLVPVGGPITGGAFSGAMQAVAEGEGGLQETLTDAATGAAFGAATGAALKGAGKLVSKGYGAGNRVINKMLNPFVGQFDDDIVRLAAEKGVDLPVSAKTSSNAVKQLEATAQKSFFGGRITKRIINARNQVDTMAEELSTKLNKDVDRVGLGNIVKGGFEKFENAFNSTKTELYDKVPEEVLTSNATLQSTKEALEKIIADKEASAAPGTNVEYYKTILKNLTEGKANTQNLGQIEKQLAEQGLSEEAIAQAINKAKETGVVEGYTPTYDILKKTRTIIGQKMKNFADPVATGDQSSLKYLYSSLSDDLETTIYNADPAAFETIQAANNFFREGIQKVNSKIGKFINTANPEKLLDGLIKPNSETDIKLVKEIIGPEATAELQEGFYNKLFNDAFDPKKEVVNPKKVLTSIKKYGEASVKEILGEDGFTRLQDNLADFEDINLLDQAIKRGTKAADGSQTAFLGNTMATIGAWMLSPQALVGKLGAEAGLVAMLSTDAGQQWLTKGLGEVAEKSGSKLSTPVPELVSKIVTKLTTLAGAKAGANSLSPDGVSASTTDPTMTSQDPTGAIASPTTSPTGAGTTSPGASTSTQPPTPLVQDPATQTGVAGIKTKPEILRLAMAQGATLKDLKEISDMYDMVNGPEQDEDAIVDKLLTRRKNLADSGLSTTKIDSQLNKMGYEIGGEGAPAVKTEAQKKFGPAVTRALSELETISGIDTNDSIFQGGSTTIGKAIKGPFISGRKATDEKFAQKVNQYSSATNLVIGAINQMLGAGTLNEGDAKRLIETMPNEKTSSPDAKAWFSNARSILGVE